MMKGLAVVMLVSGAIGLLSPTVLAQENVQNEPPVRDQDQDEQQDEKAEERQSLDELLGIEGDQSAETARETAEEEAERELERALTEQKIASAFHAAIEGMRASAELLGDRFDSGLGTQRVQEEILAKLDELLESARQQQSSSSSSSSSSSQQQQQQSRLQRNPQSRQQSGSPQQADQNATTNPADATAGERDPQHREAEMSSILEETGVEWGSLPPRFRDQLIQGLRDKPSSLYRRLTEEYYRRLAEEASR